MKRRQWISVAMAMLGLCGCSASSASDDELAPFARRVSALEDRDALQQEVIQAVSEVEGSELDELARAKLDVIEARVDELDGLITRVQTREGAVIKFFERSPGEVHVSFIGRIEEGERFSMQALSLTEIYRLAVPDGPVPAELVEATEREAELFRDMAPAEDWIGQPADAESVLVSTAQSASEELIEKHLVGRHGSVSNSGWTSHCYEYGTECLPGQKGSQYRIAREQYGWEWRYMLNSADPNGTALGTIMSGTFSAASIGPARECQLYGDYCDPEDALFGPPAPKVGPYISGVGDMVVVNTAAERYCLKSFWYPGCASQGWKLADHHGSFVAGPNAVWHLAAKPQNTYPSWSVWGSYFKP